jgi:hypothetical protein
MRFQAGKVAELVARRGTAPFQTITDDLYTVAYGGGKAPSAEEAKRVGRRVYDVLNVLSAVGVAETVVDEQGAKCVRWRGFADTTHDRLARARRECSAGQSRAETLKRLVVEEAQRLSALGALQARNQALIGAVVGSDAAAAAVSDAEGVAMDLSAGLQDRLDRVEEGHASHGPFVVLAAPVSASVAVDVTQPVVTSAMLESSEPLTVLDDAGEADVAWHRFVHHRPLRGSRAQPLALAVMPR